MLPLCSIFVPYHYNLPQVAAERLAFVLGILEAPCSDIGLETGYPD